MSLRRWPAVVALIALAVVASKVVAEDFLGLTWEGFLRQFVTSPSPLAAGALVGLLSIDLLLPVPSSLVMILSGAIFGPIPGALLSLAGSLAGNLLGFEVARRYGRPATRRFVGDEQLARMHAVFARQGGLAIVVSRPLPVLMETMSVAAGLSGMQRSTFLLASLAGTAPIVFVYAYAGSRSMAEGTLVPAIVMLLGVVAAGWLVARTLGWRMHLLAKGRPVDAEHLRRSELVAAGDGQRLANEPLLDQPDDVVEQ